MLPEALRVAREHVNYSALQGLSPRETLRTMGLKPRLGHVPTWDYVEQEIALQWLRLRGDINLKDKRGGYRREAA